MKLTPSQRDALPDSAFGLPSLRAYPMQDAAHARNALARAAEEYNRGNLLSFEKAEIDRKAHEILGRS